MTHRENPNSNQDFSYPSGDDILEIHEEIIADDSDSSSGVINPKVPNTAIIRISEGFYGQKPKSIHAKAAHLMRILVSDHAFVDGNKRTALNATATFYAMNGYYFDYGSEIKEILKQFARGDDVDISIAIAQCQEIARPIEQIEDSEIRSKVEELQERVR